MHLHLVREIKFQFAALILCFTIPKKGQDLPLPPWDQMKKYETEQCIGDTLTQIS